MYYICLYILSTLPGPTAPTLENQSVSDIASITTKVQGVKQAALKKLHVEPQDYSNDEWSSYGPLNLDMCF